MRRAVVGLAVVVVILAGCDDGSSVKLRGPSTTAPPDTVGPTWRPPPVSTGDTYVRIPPTTGIDLTAPAYTIPPTTKPSKRSVKP